MGLQTARHDLATEQQKLLAYIAFRMINSNINGEQFSKTYESLKFPNFASAFQV